MLVLGEKFGVFVIKQFIFSLWPKCFLSVLKSLILDEAIFVGVFAKVSDLQDYYWNVSRDNLGS